jgi:hypothetical protein
VCEVRRVATRPRAVAILAFLDLKWLSKLGEDRGQEGRRPISPKYFGIKAAQECVCLSPSLR